jgi:tRNA threonylcarbamoyladenosine biosynthesis protein TsaE
VTARAEPQSVMPPKGSTEPLRHLPYFFVSNPPTPLTPTMPQSRTLRTRRPQETEQLAHQLANRLRPGDLLALDGPLGAGKTTFVRGLVNALPGSNDAQVQSPTYALMNEYPTEPPIYHFDFYRLEDLDDLETTGYWDIVARRDGLTVIEWAARVERAVDAQCVRITFEITGKRSRRLTLEVPEGRGALLDALGP